MSGYRQAALALHGLTSDDREFVLNELPAGEQAQLRQYLSELTDLGFEPGAGAAFHADTRLREEAAAGQALDAVAIALDCEPASLVGIALAVKAWPWARAYLAQLPAPRRTLVEQAMAAYVPAPARDARLVQRLERMANHGNPALARAPQAGWFASMVQRWKR